MDLKFDTTIYCGFAYIHFDRLTQSRYVQIPIYTEGLVLRRLKETL